MHKAIEEQLQHTHTKLLWKAILFQIEKLQKHGEKAKIHFKEDESVAAFAGFAVDYNLMTVDGAYHILVKYSKSNCNIFRPIISYSLQTLMISSVQIPAYISFGHELCHTLNILEYLNKCVSTKGICHTIRNAKFLILEVDSYLQKEINFNWVLLSDMQEQKSVWGGENALDELSVIVGTKREISENTFVYLGETDFVRDHYADLSSQVEFFCWTHRTFENGDLSNLKPYSSVKNVFSFYNVVSYLRPFNLPDGAVKEEKEIKSDHQDVETILPPCLYGQYEIEKKTLSNKILTLKMLLNIPTNQEKKFCFEMSLERKGNSLFFSSFVPPIETEVVINGACVQLRNVVADGNCGAWALAQALHPDQGFMNPTFFQIKDMENLRARAATFVHNNNTTGRRIAMSASCANDLDHWLYTDDFRYFAQAIGRPIGIIVYGDGYRIYERNGNEIIYDNMFMFRMYLNLHPETLTICLIGNHYKHKRFIVANIP